MAYNVISGTLAVFLTWALPLLKQEKQFGKRVCIDEYNSIKTPAANKDKCGTGDHQSVKTKMAMMAYRVSDFLTALSDDQLVFVYIIGSRGKDPERHNIKRGHSL
jgi:hypothetical protein